MQMLWYKLFNLENDRNLFTNVYVFVYTIIEVSPDKECMVVMIDYN